MLKSLHLTAAPSVVLLALMAGCSIEQTQATSPSPTPTPSLPTEPAPSPVASLPPSQLPQTDPFQDASDKAIGAVTVSQSAQSKYDWEIVFGMWQEAITLMKAVPKSSPNYALAQKKVTEYQRNLAYAKQQAVKPVASLDLTVAQSPSAPSTAAVPKPVAQIPSAPSTAAVPTAKSSQVSAIASKSTPQAKPSVSSARKFLEEYLNDIVNKGNSGTFYWCSQHEQFKSSFFAPRSARILDFNEYGSKASAKIQLDSSNKGGMPITANWTIYMDKERDPQRAKFFPGNWCIVMTGEN